MSNKLEQVAVRLEPELRERLQRAADQDRRPLAGMIRKILTPRSRRRKLELQHEHVTGPSAPPRA